MKHTFIANGIECKANADWTIIYIPSGIYFGMGDKYDEYAVAHDYYKRDLRPQVTHPSRNTEKRRKAYCKQRARSEIKEASILRRVRAPGYKRNPGEKCPFRS